MSTTAKPKSSFLATMMSNTQIDPVAVTPPSDSSVVSPAPTPVKASAKKPAKQQIPADSFEEEASIRTTIYLPRKVSQELDFVRARYRVTRTGSIINAVDAMLHHAYYCTSCNEEVYIPNSHDRGSYHCPFCTKLIERVDKTV